MMDIIKSYFEARSSFIVFFLFAALLLIGVGRAMHILIDAAVHHGMRKPDEDPELSLKRDYFINILNTLFVAYPLIFFFIIGFLFETFPFANALIITWTFSLLTFWIRIFAHFIDLRFKKNTMYSLKAKYAKFDRVRRYINIAVFLIFSLFTLI